MLQLSVVVAYRFTFEAEHVSILVEEEVVLVVMEPAKSYLLQGIGAVNIHASQVTIRNVFMLRLFDVLRCQDDFTSPCGCQLLVDTFLELVQSDFLHVQIAEVCVLYLVRFLSRFYCHLNNHECRMVIYHTFDHFAYDKPL